MHFRSPFSFALLAPLGIILTAVVCAADGPLVIVGGGGVPEDVQKKFVELAGGNNAKIVVIPQASTRSDRGNSAVELFQKLDAKQVVNLELTDVAQAKQFIADSTGIWFSGGDQSRLMKALQKAELVEFIRQRHRSGITIGGTSAGAAVMSQEMIIDMPKEPGLVAGNTPMANGLGLLPDVIVDQHFVNRGRLARLLSAVLDQTELLGVGIDEKTAIIVSGDQFEVLGAGNVLVVDARKSHTGEFEAGQLQNGSDLKLHVLKAGQVFSLRF